MPPPRHQPLSLPADVQLLELRLEAQTVLVETTAAAERVRELLEKSGRRAVLKGMGGSDDGKRDSGASGRGNTCAGFGVPTSLPAANLGAAVAALSGPGAVRGLVRFLQISPTRCLVDGAVDGLPPGPHGIHVHEFGDLSRPCDRYHSGGGGTTRHDTTWGWGRDTPGSGGAGTLVSPCVSPSPPQLRGPLQP